MINRNLIIAYCQTAVLSFFNGDEYKMQLWFNTKNPLLGDMKPKDMINIGREQKLAKFIKNTLDKNEKEL